MAEIKEIIVSRSCKVNLGNYESMDQFLSVKAEVDPTFDDPEEVLRDLERLANRAMLAQLARSYEVRGKKISAEQIAKHHGLSQE